MNDLLGKATPFAELRRALAQLLVKRDECGVILVCRLHLFHRHDDRGQVSLGG